MARIPISLAPPASVPNYNPQNPFRGADQTVAGFAGPSAGHLSRVNVLSAGPNLFARESGVLRSTERETQGLAAQGRAAQMISQVPGEVLTPIAQARAQQQAQADREAQAQFQSVADVMERQAIESTRAKNAADLMVADAGLQQGYQAFLQELPADPEGWQKLYTERLKAMRADLLENAELSDPVKERLGNNFRVFEAQSRMSLERLATQRRVSLAKAKGFSAVDAQVELGNTQEALNGLAAMAHTGMITPETLRSEAGRIVKVTNLKKLDALAKSDPEQAIDILSGKGENSEGFLALMSDAERKRKLTRAQSNLAKAQADHAAAITGKMDQYLTEEDFQSDLAAGPLNKADREKLVAQWVERPKESPERVKTILALKQEADRITPENDPEGTRTAEIRKAAAIEGGAKWLSWLDRILPVTPREKIPSDAAFKLGTSYIDTHYLRTDPEPTAESDFSRYRDYEQLQSYLTARDAAGKETSRDDVLQYLKLELGVNVDDPLVPVPPEAAPATVKPPTAAQQAATQALAARLGVKPNLAQFTASHGMEDSLVLHAQLSGRLRQAMSARVAKSATDDAATAGVLREAQALDDNTRLDVLGEVYRNEMRRHGLDPKTLTQSQIDSHIASVLAHTEPQTPEDTLQAIRRAVSLRTAVGIRTAKGDAALLPQPGESQADYQKRVVEPLKVLRSSADKETQKRDAARRTPLDAVSLP